MTDDDTILRQRRVFGAAPAGIACRPRTAAYAVMLSSSNEVAAVRHFVRGRNQLWLPGGGSLYGESAEDTVRREVEEELGRSVQILERLGEATQFFYASDDAIWYEMDAVFFLASLDGAANSSAEFQLLWAELASEATAFFHESHRWAAELAASRRRL